MSRLKASGVAWVAAAALSAGIVAGAPAVPVGDPSAPANLAAVTATAAPPGGGLPAPIGTPAGTTVVPLPPGVFVGLFGLASAAVARRRYLRRH